jgi:hypothetical protein
VKIRVKYFLQENKARKNQMYKFKYSRTDKIKHLVLIISLLLVPNAQAEGNKLTAYELHRKLISFYDNYQEAISETIDTIITRRSDPDSRLGYQAIKVVYSNAAIDIAIEPDPLQQLLDMLVLIRLQKDVWSKSGHAFSEKEDSRYLYIQLQEQEKKIINIASFVFTKDEIDNVLSLSDDWIKQHPDRSYIAFVRFSDFGESELKNKFEDRIKSGGLFASINETRIEIEAARLTGERAIFLANHLPILLEWQAELYLYRVLATEEIRTLIKNGDEITRTSNELVNIASSLPTDIGLELQKLIENNHQPIREIVENIAKSSDNFRSISDDISPIFLKSDNNEDGEIDLQQVENIFGYMKDTSSKLVILSERISEFTYDDERVTFLAEIILRERLAVDELITRHQNRTGLILAGLIVLFFVCLTLTLLLIRRKSI